MARYQSQRSQYLRVILEVERDIARLCRLYESGGSFEGAVVFRLERVSYEGASRHIDVGVDSAGQGVSSVGDENESPE